MTFDAHQADRQRGCIHAEVKHYGGATTCTACGVCIDYEAWLRHRGARCGVDLLELAFAMDAPGETFSMTHQGRESADKAISVLELMIEGARVYAESSRPFAFDYFPISRTVGLTGEWEVWIAVVSSKAGL